ncbi:MAG: hypothetical protein ACRDFX_04555 [Chloroflexota bacterium]
MHHAEGVGGYLLWVAALGAFAAGPRNVLVLGVLFIASGMATALIETVQTTWGALLLAERFRGRGLGLVAGFTRFGQFASGLIVGLIWSGATARPAFIVSAVLAIAGFAVTLTVQRSAFSEGTTAL